MTENDPGRAGQKRRRARLEERRRRLFDSSVPSPCIAVCRIDETSGLCFGCRRNIDEIRDWIIMTPQEKRVVLAEVARRRAELGEAAPTAGSAGQ